MTKQEALSIIKLLSALESWAWSTGKCLPDHTSMALEAAMGLLEREVLRPRSKQKPRAAGNPTQPDN